MKNVKKIMFALLLALPVVCSSTTFKNFQDKYYLLVLREQGASPDCQKDRGSILIGKYLYLYPGITLMVNKENYKDDLCLEVHVNSWAAPGKFGPFSSSDECTIEVINHDTVIQSDEC